MDLRIERTKRNIINAFLELRAKKPLEKITVKELAELAMINKATFYSHYSDIYDLSEQLETEFIDSVLRGIPHLEDLIENPKLGVESLFLSLLSQQSLSNILFSDSRASVYAWKLEAGLKKLLYELYPQHKNSLEWDIVLTVLIQGCFQAFSTHATDNNMNQIIEIIGNINEAVVKTQTAGK